MIDKMVRLLRNCAPTRYAAKACRAALRGWKRLGVRIRRVCPLKGVDISRFDTVILFENRFGWEKILKQRPQQMAEHFPQNVLFLYHSDYSADYRTAPDRIRRIRENLYVLDYGCYLGKLMQMLSDHPNKYVMLYSTGYLPQNRARKYRDGGYRFLYDYVDDIDSRLCGDRLLDRLTEQYARVLCDPTAVIITTATRLYGNVKTQNPRADVHLVSNGVDCAHFQKERFSLPDDLRPIREKYGTVVGYYGALASWFDYDLVASLCRSDPDCAVVLLGVDYDGTLARSGVTELPNVFYLGRKDYAQLPDYVHFFDVCTIPFHINEITLATSPVKLFEYMAAGKPIVTTRLPECEKYRSVLIADGAVDFSEKIGHAVSCAADPTYQALLRQEADENTWERKAQAVADCLTPVKHG